MIEGRDFAAASTIGARQRQEDDWGTHVKPPALEAHAKLLAVVADGMGGLPAGDQASTIALRAFLDSYQVLQLPARERLRRALAHANREVGIAVEENPEWAGMGSTLVASLFLPDRCEWLSVGDSLLLRCRDGALERMNPLHIYANVLDDRVRRDEISAEEADRHPDRALLTSVVQGSAMDEVAQDALRLIPGDILVLASDGIGTLADEEVAEVCTAHAADGAGRIAEGLIARIQDKRRERQDNATVIVVCHELKQGADRVVVEGAKEEALEEAGVLCHSDPEDAVPAACAPEKPTGAVDRGELARRRFRLIGAFLFGMLAGGVAWEAFGRF